MENLISIWQRYPRLEQLLWVFIVAAVILVVVRIIQGFLRSRIKETDTRYRMRKFVSFFGYLLIILYTLSAFSDKLGSFAVVLGVVGAGIAFALQEVIMSVAGWISISLGQVFKTGDRILMGGIRGDVIDVGVLRTTLMELGGWVEGDQYNGRIVRVSNSLVFKEPVYNYSADFPFLWDEITLPIRYGSDLAEARSLLERVAAEVVGDYVPIAAGFWEEMLSKYYIEKASVHPAVTITADENWVTYTLRYVVDMKKRRVTKDRIYSRALEEIALSGGRVSLAATSLELSTAPYLDVRVLDADRKKTP